MSFFVHLPRVGFSEKKPKGTDFLSFVIYFLSDGLDTGMEMIVGHFFNISKIPRKCPKFKKSAPKKIPVFRLGSGYPIPGIPERDRNYFVIPEPVCLGPEPDRNRPLDRRVPGMPKGDHFYSRCGYF